MTQWGFIVRIPLQAEKDKAEACLYKIILKEINSSAMFLSRIFLHYLRVLLNGTQQLQSVLYRTIYWDVEKLDSYSSFLFE